jgi:hypothetical protein
MSGLDSCSTDHLFGEGENQSDTGVAVDQAGNTATTDVSNIDVDLTAPTADAHLSGTPGDAGWFIGDIAVTWTVHDALSGPLPGTCTDSTIDADGQGQVTCIPQDVAGNTGTGTSDPYKRDATKPTITAQITPDRPTSGWWNSDSGAPTVTYDCDDSTSGIQSCSGPSTFGEGADQTTTGTAVDKAGNTANKTLTDIDVDLTAPSVAVSVTGTVGNNGWYVSNVDVSFAISETGSGLGSASADCLGGSVTTDTVAETFTCTVTDNAGNASEPASVTIKRDATAPTVIWDSLINSGDSYYFGDVPVEPTCNGTDALSGMAGTCSIGGYATTAGLHTLTANATDKAGNVAAQTRSYSVLAWSANGYYRPVDMGGVLNTVKGGSTVPLKFEVFAGPSELTDVSTTVRSYAVTVIGCASLGTLIQDPIESMASTGGTAMRYDWVAGQFIQNWLTPRQAGSCYQATVKLQDGSRIDAFFKTK